MTKSSEPYRRLFVATALVAGVSLCANAAFLVLPRVIPPPEPAGYAPYQAAYNIPFIIFPLMIAGAALLLGVMLAMEYRVRTRDVPFRERRRRLAVLAAMLLPGVSQVAFVVGSFALNAAR